MAISAQHTKFVYPDYVSPLPAEDLIKVALKKQEQFDQNVTKVQSQLDAYGQLKSNIYNEAEKAYFDETMTNLVKAVNSSAGIDFSKTANVQAVLNIGKPLEKDNVIVNSIQNGKEIQRRQQVISQLDGSKRGPANDWLFMQDAMDYMKSDKLGTSIAKGKEYNEFVDISGMVVDFVKNFSKEEQDEFYSEGKGTPQGYIEKITQQGFSKTKLSEKIKGMLAADPKAYNQLQIDTQYAYNNLGPQRAHQMYVEDQTLKVASFDESIASMQEQLNYYSAQNARVKSPTVQKEIDALKEQIETFSKYRTVAFQNASKPLDQFNPEDYFQTYQNNFVTSLSNTYSFQKISRDLKDDKVWDIIQERNMEVFKNNLDIEKEKVKAGLTNVSPEKILAKKKTLWEMNNVGVQDAIFVPPTLAASTVNMDVDKLTVGEMLNSKKVVQVTPVMEKSKMLNFIAYLKDGKANPQYLEAVEELQSEGITPSKKAEYEAIVDNYRRSIQNRTYVINFKDGNTESISGDDLMNVPLLALSEVESVMQANTTEEFSARKKTPKED
jgi:hypothetical protein